MRLGLDIGTSAVKACLMGEGGELIAEAAAPLTLQTPHPYWSEQDPASWWDGVVAAMAALGAKTPRLGEVAAIGLSGQMHGAVLLDAADRVIRPAILWNDGRSWREAERLAAFPFVAETAGAPPLPGFTAPKIMWLKEAEPAAYARIAKILLPKDYIGLRLHGGHGTDKSDAAGTLWLDQRRREWSPALAAASDTDPDWLPPCLEGVEEAGRLRPEAAAALGLPQGVPVVAGGGDAAAGAVGLGAVRDGVGFISLGTSGQMFVAADAYRPNPESVIHAYAHAAPGMWFQMAAMLNGARPLAWFAGVCGAPVADLMAEAAAVAPEDAPLFLPYLTGERTPHGDPHIRGAFHGLADGAGRAEMMRAVADAVAFSFADAADALCAGGARIDAPLAIGGGARSDLILQTIADVARLPIRRSPLVAAGPAYGAARLALGPGADLTRAAAGGDLFEPAPSDALDERLARYRALYLALKDL